MKASENLMNRFKLPRDPLFRLLVINGATGLGIALLVLGGVFLADIGNLRTLVLTADNPFLPVFMLAFGLVITLGSVVMGSAIMLLGDKNEGSGTRGKTISIVQEKPLRPVPVTVPARHSGRQHR